MRVIPVESPLEAAQCAAALIVSRIKAKKPTAENPFVLGLPTGSSPLNTYKLLIKANKAGLVDFSHVVTFNMDEYCDLPRDHPESYWTFMHENFFKHINLPPANINMLDGNAADKERECEQYEAKIRAAGGVDLFLGGVGHDGHIAFNEPGSSLTSRTRVKTLNTETLAANSRFFDGDMSKVPRTALTIGVATLMDAKEVIILATGRSKAPAVSAAVEGPVTHAWTVSALQMHPKSVIICDRDSSMELKLKTYTYFQHVEHNSMRSLLEIAKDFSQ